MRTTVHISAHAVLCPCVLTSSVLQTMLMGTACQSPSMSMTVCWSGTFLTWYVAAVHHCCCASSCVWPQLQRSLA